MSKMLFFMTPGNGLGTWQQTGTIGRELAIYRKYLKMGWNVTIASFDRNDLNRFEGRDFDLVFPPPPNVLFLLPWALKKAILKADLLKTNQSVMAWWYVWAARLHRKPLLLRCGYVTGEAIETTQGRTLRTKLYQLREGWAFRNATFCLVPTESLRQWVIDRYVVNKERIGILPNFIDTSMFRPLSTITRSPHSVVSVGNMTRVKNISLLIKACAKAGATRLTLFGDGPEKNRLQQLAGDLGLGLNLPGRVTNEHLPAMLQEHAVYVQSSIREGHPKALLEAMACGMPCIGTRVPGIQDTIEHGKTGLLCELNVDSLSQCILRLFADSALSSALGENAACRIKEQFSFEKLFEKEYGIVTRLVNNAKNCK